MKITKIEAQKKTPGRYSVFIDGKFAFGISEQGLFESGLKIGQEFSKDELKKGEEVAKIDKIYNMALSQIARRQRSEWEMSEYLKSKLKDNEAEQKILNKLIDKGYVDDSKFAQSWVQSRRLLKKTNKRKLTLELKQKRVSENIINQVLARDDTDEKEVLKELIAKKRSQTRYKDDLKLMQYLTRQGFNYQNIKDLISESDD